MTSEQFAPNEYISACWQVACRVGNGNYGGYGWIDDWSHWDGQPPYGSAHDDHTGSCSQAENNVFTVSDNGNVTFDFENSSDQGELSGGYTDYIDVDGSGSISNGDIIFWYTSTEESGSRRWNHYGIVRSSANRS
mgnify:FL=1